MHVRIVGRGLSGALLAWRLADEPAVTSVTLAGTVAVADATSVSGGVVRGYEADAAQRALAVASLLELRGSPLLRAWSRFDERPCLYLSRTGAGGSVEVARAFPDSVEVLDPTGLTHHGFGSLPAGTVGVYERAAGAIDPHALREAVLREVAPRIRVLDHAPVDIGAEADLTVLATGAWTPRLLRDLGWPAHAYRTKAIRYLIARTGAWRPPTFVDEAGGLYGTPTDAGLLLGLATRDWGVAPGSVPTGAGDDARTLAAAQAMFPDLELGEVTCRVASSDCYCEPAVLQLRAVAPGLVTFTGGSGGAAKTALAASRLAARQIADQQVPGPGDPAPHRTDDEPSIDPDRRRGRRPEPATIGWSSTS